MFATRSAEFLKNFLKVINQAKNSLKRILVPVHSNALPIINHRNRGGKNNGGDSAGFLPTPLPPIVLSVTSVPTTPATPRSRPATRKSTTFQVKYLNPTKGQYHGDTFKVGLKFISFSSNFTRNLAFHQRLNV